jgi:hypothetical protein
MITKFLFEDSILVRVSFVDWESDELNTIVGVLKEINDEFIMVDNFKIKREELIDFKVIVYKRIDMKKFIKLENPCMTIINKRAVELFYKILRRFT